ncbi:MAG: MarR family transcriptional regulator [Oscillospiraceae bacterium]|nr:MarR family transcriptional regulator [Oscillospiraceae bacterium]
MEKTKTEQLNAAMRKVSRLNRFLQMKCYQSSGDLRLLRIIAHHEDVGITPSVLAEKLEIALPTVSRKLSVLEKQELIERKPGTVDRRKTYVYATEKGRLLIQEDYRRFISRFSSVYENLGEEKATRLIELLEETAGYLDEEIHREAGDED